MKKLKCKVCECEFVPEKKEYYISRGEVKTGLFNLAGGIEEKLYDTFDCPQCGCQNVVNERKRSLFRELESLKEEEEETIPAKFVPRVETIEKEPCEITAYEYRQRMIQAFQNTNCEELIFVCVLPTEKEFEYLEWLLKNHYKKEPFISKPCVSKGACHEDKIKVLDKIINEIKTLTNGAEPEHVWNVDVLAIIDKYKAESEE